MRFALDTPFPAAIISTAGSTAPFSQRSSAFIPADRPLSSFVVSAPVGNPVRRNAMCRFGRTWAAALSLVLLVPAAAFAQAAITGVVKDASGAVLPGVS